MGNIGVNSFQYWKRYQAGGNTYDASVENFFYMAIWN